MNSQHLCLRTLVACAAAGFASQASAASFTGTVTLPDGRPAFGAMLSVFNADQTRKQTVYTAETLTGRVWAFTVEAPGKFAQANGTVARRPLGHRHILGRLYKLRELVVRDFGLVHPESIHSDTMPRLGIRKLVCTHPELAAGNPDHAPRCRTGWKRRVPGYRRCVFWLDRLAQGRSRLRVDSSDDAQRRPYRGRGQPQK